MVGDFEGESDVLVFEWFDEFDFALFDLVFVAEGAGVFEEEFVEDELVFVFPGFALVFFVVGVPVAEGFAGFVVDDEGGLGVGVEVDAVDFAHDLGVGDFDAFFTEVEFGEVVGREVLVVVGVEFGEVGAAFFEVFLEVLVVEALVFEGLFKVFYEGLGGG